MPKHAAVSVGLLAFCVGITPHPPRNNKITGVQILRISYWPVHVLRIVIVVEMAVGRDQITFRFSILDKSLNSHLSMYMH